MIGKNCIEWPTSEPKSTLMTTVSANAISNAPAAAPSGLPRPPRIAAENTGISRVLPRLTWTLSLSPSIVPPNAASTPLANVMMFVTRFGSMPDASARGRFDASARIDRPRRVR